MKFSFERKFPTALKTRILSLAVLFIGTVEPRCGLEVPGCHRDLGGQEESQGPGLLQQDRQQGQGCCRSREGSRRKNKAYHRPDRIFRCLLKILSCFCPKIYYTYVKKTSPVQLKKNILQGHLIIES